ncbi:MAG: transcriptional repressor [Chlorobiales bacterium]|nr:transcriptional repressor [Chlorobiales bacterium]
MVDSRLVAVRAPQAIAEEWLEALRAAGYRPTAARRAVVEIVAGASNALRPQEIHAQAKRRQPKIGLVTVYRALEKLEELELVQCLHLPDGSHGYLAEFSGHQHLLSCTACGRVVYFEGDDLSGLVTALEAESGFRIDSHSLQFEGLCAQCHAREAA